VNYEIVARGMPVSHASKAAAKNYAMQSRVRLFKRASGW